MRKVYVCYDHIYEEIKAVFSSLDKAKEFAQSDVDIQIWCFILDDTDWMELV